MRWHVSRLVPQREWRAPRCIPGADPYSDEEEEEEGDDYWGEPEYEGDIGWWVSLWLSSKNTFRSITSRIYFGLVQTVATGSVWNCGTHRALRSVTMRAR